MAGNSRRRQHRARKRQRPPAKHYAVVITCLEFQTQDLCDKSFGTTVTTRAFADGEQVSGTARYLTTDHLGSVTELTDGSASRRGRRTTGLKSMRPVEGSRVGSGIIDPWE